MIDGVAVVDKPAGMTSHDVVARCRRIFGQKRVGHGGTLDPDATGVLIVGLGQATRLLQFVTGLSKAYHCQVVLGVATSTLDDSGEVVGRWDMSGVTVDQARVAAVGLTGDILQVPPMVSAIRIGGRRLHTLARQGIEVDRPPRPVHVERFELRPAAEPTDAPGGGDDRLPGGGPPGPSGPVLDAEVTCSSGTYVRTLAADLGAALGGGAHLRKLRRTRVGRWDERSAVALDQLDATDVLPPSAVVADLARCTVAGDVAAAVGHGRVLDHASLGVDTAAAGGPWAVLNGDGALLAVYADHGEGRAKPVLVLVP